MRHQAPIPPQSRRVLRPSPGTPPKGGVGDGSAGSRRLTARQSASGVTRTKVLGWVLASIFMVGSSSGCASWPRHWGARPCCIQTKPVVKRQSIAWHLFDVTVVSQIKQAFHVVRVGRKWFGVPVRALNLKDGDVSDTAFFTDRDPATLSPETVRWGPTHPAEMPVPPLTITNPKTEGKTPGMFVTDVRGREYLLKFDPIDAPELLSGAEVVTSKLLYALGYHVPSYEVLMLAPEELRVGDHLTFTEEELRQVIEPRVREGTVRLGVTKILEGEILGPAPFKRFRDCADVRALKVAYAWVNNIDTKDHNSLLVWDGTQTVGYLIDFGTSLGADAGRAGPKVPCAGWLNVVDLQEASLKLLTLGLHRPQCDPKSYQADASIGFLSPHVHPERWKPYAPNLAFEEMNREDGRWMARRLARLSQPQIEAAVSAGQYRNPADAAYLTDVLEQRRLTIIDYYLRKGD